MPIEVRLHQVVHSTGTVVLSNSNLDVAVFQGLEPSIGQSFTIIHNDGADPVTGTFADGATVIASGGFHFSINYAGGTGNDVMLARTAVPEPAGLALMGLGAGAC